MLLLNRQTINVDLSSYISGQNIQTLDGEYLNGIVTDVMIYAGCSNLSGGSLKQLVLEGSIDLAGTGKVEFLMNHTGASTDTTTPDLPADGQYGMYSPWLHDATANFPVTAHQFYLSINHDYSAGDVLLVVSLYDRSGVVLL